MAWNCRCWRVLVGVVLVLGDVASAQTVETALREMAARAGVIFVGQVVRVHRVDGGGMGSGVVEVEFRVDRGVRGCAVGGIYVLREWAGLWVAGEQRYRVGQRLLMLLNAPNAAGMSSPVGGMDGAIPVRGVESELASAVSHGRTSVAGPTEMVDLSWVGTRVVRPVSYSGDALGGAKVGGGLARVLPMGVRELAGGSTEVGSASVSSPGASMDAVVGMLTGWERDRAAR